MANCPQCCPSKHTCKRSCLHHGPASHSKNCSTCWCWHWKGRTWSGDITLTGLLSASPWWKNDWDGLAFSFGSVDRAWLKRRKQAEARRPVFPCASAVVPCQQKHKHDGMQLHCVNSKMAPRGVPSQTQTCLKTNWALTFTHKHAQANK